MIDARLEVSTMPHSAMHCLFARGISVAAFALAAFVTVPGPAGAQSTKLKIATEGTYAPWSYKDAQGRLLGWDVEIAMALCEKMKVECEVVAQDWDGIIPGLTAKKFDAIVASMGMTEARKQRVAFTDKYKDVVSRFVARKGAIKETSPEGMKGKTIGVQRGSIQAPFLEKNYGATSTIKVYDTTQGPELDLVAGRVDAIFGNMVTYYVGFLKQPDAKDFDYVGPEYKGGMLGDGAGIALRKEDTELLARFNKALAEIRADGTYDKITAQYFPFKLM
jgi:arginine/ornithine transport system substrate-binding protein